MTKKTKVQTINSLDEVPDFASEDEERDFWGSHRLSAELLNSLPTTTFEEDAQILRQELGHVKKRKVS
jgi:hypothetical protein